MKKHLFGAVLLGLVLASGFAGAQTIDQIQVYNPTTGYPSPAPAGPYSGQTVTVQGIIVERLNYSSGSGYIWNAGDGGLSLFGTLGETVAYGDLVSVTGTVSQFSNEIQLNNSNFTKISSGNVPVPVDMTIAQIKSDYENVGNFTRTTGIVSKIGTPSGINKSFYIHTGTDTIMVFIDGTTGIDITQVAVGDTYQVTAPCVVFNGLMELKPVLQSLLVENPLGDTVPVISNLACSNWAPTASTPVTVSADITDNISVASAALYYRNSDGTTPGAWQQVAMTHGAGNSWSGVIPAAHPQSQVNFYVRALDSAAQPATYPGNAPTGFVTLAVGFTSIYAMQTVHPDSLSQNNNFNGKYLNVKGVVTAAGAAQAGAASKLIVQELAKNPATNSYAFGGVLVYESSGKYPYYQGDVVEVGGMGSEYFGLTEFLPHNGDAINLVSFGHALPVPSHAHTRAMADDMTRSDGNGAMGEAWESVWMQTYSSAVVDTVGLAQYREWLISDTGARADSLMVDTYTGLAYVPTIGNIVKVTGFMDYEFGAYKIRPIDDSYVELTGATAVDNNVPTIDKAGGFRSVAPNPFNPATTIKFVINRADLVQLNVYNIRGEKVRTLVQDRLPATEYSLVWDGTDDAGKNVASGSYFARLRIGKEVMQVRQMQLVK
jgi:hypothetical protein